MPYGTAFFFHYFFAKKNVRLRKAALRQAGLKITNYNYSRKDGRGGLKIYIKAVQQLGLLNIKIIEKRDKIFLR